jgi:hypothetical protein
MLSDLRGLTRVPGECAAQLQRIVEAARARDSRRVVRVVGRSAAAALQFERVSRSIGHEACLPFSLGEAERMLDGGGPP